MARFFPKYISRFSEVLKPTKELVLGISLDNGIFSDKQKIKSIVRLLNSEYGCFETCIVIIADFPYSFYVGNEEAERKAQKFLNKWRSSKPEFPPKVLKWKKYVETCSEEYKSNLELIDKLMKENTEFQQIIADFEREFNKNRYTHEAFLNYLRHDLAMLCTIKSSIIYPGKMIPPAEFLIKMGYASFIYYEIKTEHE